MDVHFVFFVWLALVIAGSLLDVSVQRAPATPPTSSPTLRAGGALPDAALRRVEAAYAELCAVAVGAACGATSARETSEGIRLDDGTLFSVGVLGVRAVLLSRGDGALTYERVAGCTLRGDHAAVHAALASSARVGDRRAPVVVAFATLADDGIALTMEPPSCALSYVVRIGRARPEEEDSGDSGDAVRHEFMLPSALLAREDFAHISRLAFPVYDVRTRASASAPDA